MTAESIENRVERVVIPLKITCDNSKSSIDYYGFQFNGDESKKEDLKHVGSTSDLTCGLTLFASRYLAIFAGFPQEKRFV